MFHSNRDQNDFEIYVMDRDGIGRELVFMSTRDGYPSVFRMDADGGNQINLTPQSSGRLAGRLGEPRVVLVNQRSAHLLHVAAASDRR